VAVLVAAFVALTACAGAVGPLVPLSTASGGAAAAGTAPSWAPRVQALWGFLKADAGAYEVLHPADKAVIDKTVSDLNPEIAALSNDPTPTTIATAVADITNAVNALPSGVVSPHTQLLLNLISTGLQLGSGFLGFSAAPAHWAALAALQPQIVAKWELAP
jgi:hypothetical protein